MLADVLLENIKEYGLLHCSQSITDALIVGTRLGLPAVKSYLESRVRITEHKLLVLSQTTMQDGRLRKSDAIEGEYGYVEAPIWGSARNITSDLFKPYGVKLPTRFETIDLPELH